jgi:hypothetical protein
VIVDGMSNGNDEMFQIPKNTERRSRFSSEMAEETLRAMFNPDALVRVKYI